MKVDLDAKVRTHDGQDAGHVHRAVFDPINETVTHFLVSTGSLLGREVLVPSQELESATQDGDHIVLRLTKDELKALPDYLPTGYAPAPAGWMAPAGYGLSTETFLWPAGVEMMGEDEDDEVTLGKGETVLDVDGHDLGVVEDVLLDEESGRLQGFVRAGRTPPSARARLRTRRARSCSAATCATCCSPSRSPCRQAVSSPTWCVPGPSASCGSTQTLTVLAESSARLRLPRPRADLPSPHSAERSPRPLPSPTRGSR